MLLEWGKEDDVTEEVCRRFFAHNSGLGWMYGKTPIANPRRWLKCFAERAKRPQRAPRAASVLWEKKTRLEQLKKMWEEHHSDARNLALKDQFTILEAHLATRLGIGQREVVHLRQKHLKEDLDFMKNGRRLLYAPRGAEKLARLVPCHRKD